MNRAPLPELARTSFDVLVVGAGINGAGAAQQLASRGYRVLIADKGDFSAGATNRSSRILHCGLRHLAPGKSLWDFVRRPNRFWVACKNAQKSMHSRSDLASTMSELVRPFRFCFPLYQGGAYAPWQVDVAFKLLEGLGPKNLPLDYVRHKKPTLDQVPFSRWMRDQEALVGFAVFRDYQFLSAERVVVDTLRDAVRMGAIARNYTECKGVRRNGDSWEVAVADTLETGQTAIIKVKLVLNATGPWSDHLTERLTKQAERRMVGLKGIHIVVKLPEELRGWGMMAINRENETIYCLPWDDLHYVGPTRTPYNNDLDQIVCTQKEMDWMLSEINFLMPQVKLTRNDVVYTYAGIQPVSCDQKDPKGTREIKIHDLAEDGFPNILSLTGGPIMTYRIVGNDLADAVSKRISPTGPKHNLSLSASSLSKEILAPQTVFADQGLSPELLMQIMEQEQTANLVDLYFHRSNMGWTEDLGLSTLEASAKIMAKVEDWDEDRTQSEIRNYRDYIGRLFPNYMSG